MNMERMNRNITILLYFLFFVLIFIINSETPLLADDYSYTYGIVNFVDAIMRWVNAYLTHCGRISNLYCSIFLGCFNKFTFNVFNTSVYLFLIYLIDSSFQKVNPYRTFLIFLLCWIFVPARDETIFWCSGACNYLWPLTFSLIAVKFIFKKQRSIRFQLLFTPLFIIAGMGHEGISLGVSFAFILYFILYRGININKVWIFFYIIGCFISVFAPGNFNRVSDSSAGISFAHVLDLFLFPLKNPILCFNFILLMIFIIYSFIFYKQNLYSFLRKNVFYFIVLFVSYSLIVFVGVSYSRAFFFVEMISLYLVLKFLMPQLSITKLKYQFAFITILSFAFLYSYTDTLKYTFERNKITTYNIQNYNQSSTGVFHVKTVNYRTNFLYNSFEHADSRWLNKNRSLYYNKPRIWGLTDLLYFNLSNLDRICRAEYRVENSTAYTDYTSSMFWMPVDKNNIPAIVNIYYKEKAPIDISLFKRMGRYQVMNKYPLSVQDNSILVKNKGDYYLLLSKPYHLLDNRFEIKGLDFVGGTEEVNIECILPKDTIEVVSFY